MIQTIHPSLPAYPEPGCEGSSPPSTETPAEDPQGTVVLFMDMEKPKKHCVVQSGWLQDSGTINVLLPLGQRRNNRRLADLVRKKKVRFGFQPHPRLCEGETIKRAFLSKKKKHFRKIDEASVVPWKSNNIPLKTSEIFSTARKMFLKRVCGCFQEYTNC